MITNLQFKSDKINITPDFPCVLMGMEDSKQSEGIFSKLEVNTMVFKNGEKNIYFISIDTLFITNELKRSTNELINNVFGQANEIDIIQVSSHTHYAPALEDKRIKLGKKDEKYFSFLLSQLESLFKNLKSIPFVEVELKYSEQVSKGITCNRRRRARSISNYLNSFIAMEPNPKGFIDERFKRLNIYNSVNQKLMGTMWSFPCHPTNFPNKTLISSEFPGEIRNYIRRLNETDATVIYFPGFAGDVRAVPPKRRSFLKLIRTIFQLSYPVSYYRFSNIEEYTAWKDSLVEIFAKIDSDENILNCEGATLETKTSEEPLKSLGIEVEDINSLQFRQIKIGQDFAFYTISAEPVGKYSEIFNSNINDKFAICTGYTDSVFGYLPMQSQVTEGGYESEGFFDAFLVRGQFNNKIEKTVISHIKKFNNVR
tara:strand:+ start:693 stop:1973 length:1281 start_codon:yes stop_codon:yes gene_type:complete